LAMLKKMRTAKDATMRQVADAAGISESMYCLIESGKRRPSPDVAKKIGSYGAVDGPHAHARELFEGKK